MCWSGFLDLCFEITQSLHFRTPMIDILFQNPDWTFPSHHNEGLLSYYFTFRQSSKIPSLSKFSKSFEIFRNFQKFIKILQNSQKFSKTCKNSKNLGKFQKTNFFSKKSSRISEKDPIVCMPWLCYTWLYSTIFRLLRLL